MTNSIAKSTVLIESDPSTLIEDIISSTRLDPGHESYAIAKRGLSVFLGHMLEDSYPPMKVDPNTIDFFISEIDNMLTKQINEILHHPSVQKLESKWRSLKFLVDRVDFRENIRIEMLQAQKHELAQDFDDTPEIPKSGLYSLIYSNEYGVFGGQPYGLIIGDFSFSPKHQDIQLLNQIASVAAMAHAPFISNASPTFFSSDTFEDLPNLKDLKSLLEGPHMSSWHAFRANENSRYVGLCLPRFLLRLPYSEDSVPIRSFNFTENVTSKHSHYLWGNASVALATRIAESFANYRWCPHIVGPNSGGTIEDLPMHYFESMGVMNQKIPTEILLTERREFELADEGFIGLTFRKDSNSACFFSANSVQKPKIFAKTEEGSRSETNFRLGTQLPYMFIMTRLAHYIKVLQRESLGGYKDRNELQRDLNTWLSQYVSDMEDPAFGVRARRPLRRAQILVEDVESQPGWYRCRLQVQPHLKYMGSSFTLSLVGRLDKN